MNTSRDIFIGFVNANYDPPPPRSKAPEIGYEAAKATFSQIKSNEGLIWEIWLALCKQWASRYLKDPPEDDLQSSFAFFKTPQDEQTIINQIGHRRMQTPDDDGAMVDLVDPHETSSDELFRLADRLEGYGKQCIERAKYVRQLAKARKRRGF
jgi:hypothetical protein